MISDVYFPRVNGVSTSIQTFRRELRELGHRVTLVVPDYGTETDDEEDVIRIPSRYLFVDPEDRMMKSGRIMKLAGLLQDEEIDLIHIQTPFVAHHTGVKLSKLLNVPRVESYHTFFEEYLFHYIPYLPKSWMRGAARLFSRWQCNNVDSIVVPSTAMLDVLRDYGVRSNAEIIPTGIELDDFKGGDGDRFRIQNDIAMNRPALLFVGRVAFEKNISFLLRMVQNLKKKIPNILFMIAGEGPALEQLQSEASELGLESNVKYIGYLDRDGELQDCYAAANAFVFASRTETQGLVLLEAMALGVPVVSTAVMGTRDILEPRQGALVAEEDVEHFSSQVMLLLSDQKLQQSLKVQARTYAKSWSAPYLASKMLDFYEEVCCSKTISAEYDVKPAVVMDSRSTEVS